MFTSKSVYHDPDIVELYTPYNSDFVDAIKLQVPPSHREWSPGTKTWFVRSPYDTTATRILSFYFPGAEVGGKPAERPLFSPPDQCRCDADHRALFVCQNAPDEVVKAAYRALAKLNHPDAGGDHSRMQIINIAYERIASEVR